MVPVTIQPLSSDESLFVKVTQVTRAWIGGSAVVVSKVARRYDTERADGRQRACF